MFQSRSRKKSKCQICEKYNQFKRILFEDAIINEILFHKHKNDFIHQKELGAYSAERWQLYKHSEKLIRNMGLFEEYERFKEHYTNEIQQEKALYF